MTNKELFDWVLMELNFRLLDCAKRYRMAFESGDDELRLVVLGETNAYSDLYRIAFERENWEEKFDEKQLGKDD